MNMENKVTKQRILDTVSEYSEAYRLHRDDIGEEKTYNRRLTEASILVADLVNDVMAIVDLRTAVLAKCPQRNYHLAEFSVERIAADKYRCKCGCVFNWTDDFHWEVLESGSYGPTNTVTGNDSQDKSLTREDV